MDEYKNQRKVYIDPKTGIEYESILGRFVHKRMGNDQLIEVDSLPKGCVLKDEFEKKQVVEDEPEEVSDDEPEEDEIEDEPEGENEPDTNWLYTYEQLKKMNKEQQVELIGKLYERTTKESSDNLTIPRFEEDRIRLIMQLEKEPILKEDTQDG